MELLDARENEAAKLVTSQDSLAEELRLGDSRSARKLLDERDRATQNLLVAQAALRELLGSHDVEGAERLLKAQDDATRALISSQAADADLLSSSQAEGAKRLREAYKCAAVSLLTSEISTAGLLRSHEARSVRRLLEIQIESARNLLASQSSVAELLQSNDVKSATTLLEAQVQAARNLLASQTSVAELLRLHDEESVMLLLKAQERAAQNLIASEAAVSSLLKSKDPAGATPLVQMQHNAAKELLASQAAVAKLLISDDLDGGLTLLDEQEELTKNLLRSQASVTGLLRRHGVVGAVPLLEALDDATSNLLAFQASVALLLKSHAQEVATITALNVELEQRVRKRTMALTAANAGLVATSLAKSDFLASMSHELRTPLNSIIGFSDLLESGMVGELEPEQKKQIGIINSAGRHLLEVVNEVLDLSAIEAGHVRVDLRPVDVSLIVREVVESLAPPAESKGLEMSFDVPPASAAMITDKTRLEQVLFNLLGNAIKFTDAGSVRVEVRRDKEGTIFTVSDTGRGIEAADLHRIFDDFYQGEYGDSGEVEGTGLGLAVSRHIVELLGGTISATSEPGKGTTLTFRLPTEGHR